MATWALIEDMLTIAPLIPARTIDFAASCRARKGAGQVDVDHRLEIGERGLEEILRQGAARVVHQDRDRPRLGLDGLEGPRDLVGVPHVACESERAVADLVRGFPHTVALDINQGEASAVGGDGLGAGAADAACGAGDHGKGLSLISRTPGLFSGP